MPAPAWTWVESAGTALDEKPRIAESQFGDGYVQRALDGLNPIRQSWPLTFRDVENSVADQMIAFLRARVNSTTGLEPFPWTPLWATTPIMVVCKQWKRTHSETYGESQIDLVFEQDFSA